MKPNNPKKIRPDETPVQLGKAELLESTKIVHEANGDITEHINYRTPPRMGSYVSFSTIPDTGKFKWKVDKERARKRKETEQYWAKKKREEQKMLDRIAKEKK